jgi:predicted nucleic acid-binding protein
MGRGARVFGGEAAGRGVSRLVLLDNEAVQALRDPAHRKHQRALDEIQFAVRRAARTASVRVAVPVAVRVEAGWDRTASAWAFVNRFGIDDIPLDAVNANAAASVAKRTGVSVADAHLGAAIQAAVADRVTVLTSDPRDMRKVAEGRQVNIVTL